MGKIKLLLWAFTPFLIGYALNYLYLNYDLHRFALFISAGFFLYWFLIGRRSARYTKSGMQSLLLGSSFIVICLGFILYQEIFLGRYMDNPIGIVPQLFYLPALDITLNAERLFVSFLPLHNLWMTYILEAVLMIAVYSIGYRIRIKKRKLKHTWR